jgi:serine phosphatase RsbU (regulator of sigma subunit)/anti-sigma regulatory factor (Ser/Thr protein kinase)
VIQAFLIPLAFLAGALSIWTVLLRRNRRILRSKRHLEAIFDHIDPIAVVDPKLHTLRVNRAFLHLAGRSFRELLGADIAEVLSQWGVVPSDLTRIRERTEKSVLREISLHLGEGERLFDLHIYPVLSSAQVIDEIVVHMQEVTQLALTRRRANDASDRLRLLNEELSSRNIALKTATDAISAEIDVAREIQRGILPRNVPDLPGLNVQVRYEPARPVGGDLYDFVHIDEYRIGFFLADVSGHGLPAAFEGAMVKMSFQHHAATCQSPAEVLRHMNADLRKSLAPGHYVTAFYGILDLVDHSLVYCRAAHPKPLLLRASGAWERLESSGLFVGIVEDADYRNARVQLGCGDRLHLFTDGYYEGLECGSARGYEALKESLSQGVPLVETLCKIEQSLDAVPAQEDDRTFIQVELTQPARLRRFRLLARFLPGDPLQVRRLRNARQASEAAEAFGASLALAGWPMRVAKRLRLAADEMCANAIEHGVKGRADRKAWVGWSVRADSCRFAVHDGGDGFNADALPDPRSTDRIHLSRGRGIYMTRQSVDRLWFDHGGRTATFFYKLKNEGPAD